jgi:hypothetical protein
VVHPPRPHRGRTDSHNTWTTIRGPRHDTIGIVKPLRYLQSEAEKGAREGFREGNIETEPYLKMGVVATLLVWADVMAGDYEDHVAGQQTAGSG